MLIDRAPVHVWLEHPRLGNQPQPRSEPSRKMQIGSAVHDYVLTQDIDSVVVVEADSYRTNQAKAERDLALAQGRNPVLLEDFGEVQARSERLLPLVERLGIVPAGCEMTCVWEDGGAYHRCRFDAPVPERNICYDLKCTGLAATPDGWGRTNLWRMYDLQLGHYRRGWLSHYGELPDFRYIVQEDTPPYSVRIFTVDSQGFDWCDGQADLAAQTWADCWAEYGENRWPDYDTDVVVMDTPGWLAAQMEPRFDGTHLGRDRR